MAIFKGVDAERLPALTQFYQAEGASEMYKLALRFTEGEGDELFPYGGPDNADVVSELLNVQVTVRAIMDAVADDLTIEAKTIYDYVDFLNEMNPWAAVVWRERPAEPGEFDGEVLEIAERERARARAVSLRPTRVHRLQQAVLETLAPLLEPDRNYEALKRCASCASVFVVTRRARPNGDPVCCSHRCRNRVAQRVRDNKQREKLFRTVSNNAGMVQMGVE